MKILRYVCVGAFFLGSTRLPVSAQGDDVGGTYPIMIELNKAQIVMLAENNLIPQPLAHRIAAGIQQLTQEQSRAGGQRSGDYLVFEDQLVKLLGPEASDLHMGRSRIDMGASTERIVMRSEMLGLFGEMISAREKLVALAAKNVNTIIAGYTHAVQAQPTSLGHYLLAIDSALERDNERLRQTYARINRSPLGAAAFGTSGFPLDRRRLSTLMGFEAPVENSYDATSVSTVDSKAELAADLAVSALTLGRFSQDLVIQFGDPAPGLNLGDALVGHSSIMPQKRNPGAVERLRSLSSAVVGDAQTVWIVSHNTPVGDVGDVRANLVKRVQEVTVGARQMYKTLGVIAGGLVVRPDLTLAKVDSDFSTMTELADALLRYGGIPFRVGHHVASEVASYGRAQGKPPKSLTYEEISNIYQKVTGNKIPISAAQVREAIDAQEMVAHRRGLGGPQPQEVERMLTEHKEWINSSSEWLKGETKRLREADEAREQAFLKLAGQ